ncbi:MAG: hypothetical protein V3S14_16955, partial [Anaerolineae bacterium]
IFGSGVTQRATFNIALAPLTLLSPDVGEVFTATNGVSATVPVRVDTPYTTLPDEGYWALWGNGVRLASPVLTYTTAISLPIGTHTLSATLHTTDTQLLATSATVNVVIVSGLPRVYLPLVARNWDPSQAILQNRVYLPLIMK